MVAQEDPDAALAEVEAAARGPGPSNPGPNLDTLDPAAPAGAVLAALAARRAAATERETALGRWALALTAAAARLASKGRALRARAEQARHFIIICFQQQSKEPSRRSALRRWALVLAATAAQPASEQQCSCVPARVRHKVQL